MASVEMHNVAGSITLSPGGAADIGAGYFKPGQWCRPAVSLNSGQPMLTWVQITGKSVNMESDGTLLSAISVSNPGTNTASFTLSYIIVTP